MVVVVRLAGVCMQPCSCGGRRLHESAVAAGAAAEDSSCQWRACTAARRRVQPAHGPETMSLLLMAPVMLHAVEMQAVQACRPCIGGAVSCRP